MAYRGPPPAPAARNQPPPRPIGLQPTPPHAQPAPVSIGLYPPQVCWQEHHVAGVVLRWDRQEILAPRIYLLHQKIEKCSNDLKCQLLATVLQS